MASDALNDDAHYDCVKIDTPFLKACKKQQINEGQAICKHTVCECLKDASIKSVVIKSRYGSGKTTFLRRLIQNQHYVIFCSLRIVRHLQGTSI